MNIIVDINHPAHVHYFKNFVWEMERRFHEVLITASEKEISYKLLDLYGFNYVRLGGYGVSLVEKLVKMPILDLKMYNAVKDFNPDIFIGVSSIRNAHISKLLGKPCIALDDTEYSKLVRMLYLPFTKVVLTPSCFKKDLGNKQVRYNGYNELAHLHPKYFNPDPSILDELNLSENDIFIVVRFISWDSTHDIGQSGIKNRVNFVRKLKKYGRVLITSEGTLEKSLEKYRITKSPEKFHNLLWYATLYIGEGVTIASESSILGTPSIYISSLAGRLGYLDELEQKYNLMYSFANSDDALKKAIEIFQIPNIKEDWRIKKETMLRDKIDVTEFIVQFIENYPQSITHNE